jgi:hypothetical protein
MSPEEIQSGCTWLFHQWCERRAVRPLRHLLSAWSPERAPSRDDASLREALSALQAECRRDLSCGEIARVQKLIGGMSGGGQRM